MVSFGDYGFVGTISIAPTLFNAFAPQRILKDANGIIFKLGLI